MNKSEQLDAVFSALANPTRRAILLHLSKGDATVNSLAEPFEMSLPAISKHIRVLETAGLITRTRNAQFRPCKLNTLPLEVVASWTDQYRHIWETRFDMMSGILQTMPNKKGRDTMSDEPTWVRIERKFNAPIQDVWNMWTDPDLFKQWYGPMGMSVPTAEMNVVVGGKRKVCMEMQSPERTMSMWFTGVYKEVNSPSRLVYTESMCTEDGTIISPQSMGMPEGSPDVTEVIIELSETDGMTTMTMVHVGVLAGTAGDGGWNQAIDKLFGLLEASK